MTTISNFIPVDQWFAIEEGNAVVYNIPSEDQVYGIGDRAIILGSDPAVHAYLLLSSKRAYSSEKMINHLTHYLNYFTKFYDPEKVLLSVYQGLYTTITFKEGYSKDDLINHIKEFILSGKIANKVKQMNMDNFHDKLVYEYPHPKNSPALTYSEEEAIQLMETSLFIKFSIPLIAHFMFVNRIQIPNPFLNEVLGYIIPDILFNKICETVSTIIDKHGSTLPLAIKDDIASYKANQTHNIISMIVPKYTYDKNIVKFIDFSTRKGIQYNSMV